MASKYALIDGGQSTLKRNRLESLPNEILEVVMEFSNDFPTLQALVESSRQAQALFERRPCATMMSVVHNSEMNAHLQLMYYQIICIRQKRKYDVVNESFHTYIDTILRNQSINDELESAFTARSNPVDMLNDVVDIYKSVDEAERSFLKVQMLIIEARIRHIRSRHCNVGFKVNFLSATELHRIRRAFWRMRLYFEAFYEPYVASMIDAKGEDEYMKSADFHAVSQENFVKSSDMWNSSFQVRRDHKKSQAVFFYHMTVWELEEMECAWYHLCRQSNTLWRHICPHTDEGFLPDTPCRHIRVYSHNVNSNNTRYRYCNDFQDACEWYRMELEDTIAGETTAGDMAFWPDPLAREPSAGFEFLMNHHDDLRPGEAPPGSYREYLGTFLEWGYCIWDRERLEAWRLVDSQGGKVGARFDWWEVDTWRSEDLLEAKVDNTVLA